MFHPNIYTQKTTAFQKNCGFSVPLFYKGFSAFYIFLKQDKKQQNRTFFH